MSGAADAPVRVGDVLAEKYRVEKVLGAGAMGVVVAARHIELNELWAIKFMLPAAVANAEGVERFLREARAAARLRSRHVAKVQDVGRLPNGAPYLVMEYLEGTDLKTLLEQRGTLPVAEAVRYLLQACEALAEAHAAGIVHRDLKPANLYLTREVNGAPCVKLLDFGIAKMPAAQGAMDMTATSELLGTPLYMSPEQMRSTRDVDARSDIWALGVILYRMLAGKTPFSGSTVTEICSAVIADRPEEISRIRRDLPPGLEALVFRCLEKSPAQRFQSVAELSAALAPFANAPAAVGSATVGPQASMGPGAVAAVTAGPAGGATYGPGAGTQSGAVAASATSATYGPGGGTQAMGNAGYGAAPPVSAGYTAPPAAAGYGAPANPNYGAPANPGYGAPPVTAAAPGYGPPQGASPYAPAPASTGYGAAPAPRKSSSTLLIIGALVAVLGGGGVAAAFFFSGGSSGQPSGSGASASAPANAASASSSAGSASASGAPASSSSSTARAGSGQQPASPGGGQARSFGVAASASASASVAAGGDNLPVGSSCKAASQCTSGFCVDGVCCDSACTSRCMACTGAKKHTGGDKGSCGFISGGEDPDHECGAGKRCDGDGSCVSMTPAQIKDLTGHN
jgi:serine/threonine-protein kinase